MIKPDPTLPEDVQILIKACYHAVSKGYPCEGGFRIPKREFERMQSKVRKILEEGK